VAAGVGTAVRGLSALQGVGHALNAVDSYQKGDALGTVLNGLGGVANFAQLSGACFAAGTPLLTPDGSKPIDDFEVGDLVLSRDEDDPDGPVLAKRVLAVFRNYSPLLDLHVSGHVIRTTAQHPFWVIGRGWVAAHQLEDGDFFLGARSEKTMVEKIDGPKESGPVFNLEVEDYHTYFVKAGASLFSVWAHNDGCAAYDQFFGAGFGERWEGMFDLGWQLEGFAQNAPTLLTTMDDTLGNLTPTQYCIYANMYNFLTDVAQ
jgi:Pretoxin HINT domain